jgi:glycosyltransferase involved in cell wall biosynthesis
MIQASDPKLSIVIASCVGAPFIDSCLNSLKNQVLMDETECIVVDRAGAELAERLENEYPWVKIYRRSAGESVPDLRKFGIAQSKAEYVAVIEEHCVARADWVENILSHIESKPAAVGGVIDDANYNRLVDWAVYFTEYNSYMPPTERRETFDVCAANCVYRRDLLQEHLPASGSGYWEAGLNKALLAKGERFINDPELVVSHTGPFGFTYYLHQRFLFSRAFAGTRRRHVSSAFKVCYLLLAPLLIPLLWARTASRVFAKRRHIGKFLQVTPHMVPITATYVLGEWVGFIAGPGDSLKKIE